MDSIRARSIIDQFAQKRILVIGDLMLDEFLWGKVSRISPEAPVPIVDIIREESFPGGAANVARNLADFTKGVALMGVTGSCRHARQLTTLLTQEGIDISAVLASSDYETIVKTRVIARHQHVVRIDRERKLSLRQEHADLALQKLREMLPELDAVIIEDYGKGLFDQRFVDSICSLVNEAGKVLAVDPNPNNPLEWKKVTVIKPNRAEAFAIAKRAATDPTDDPVEDTDLHEVGMELMGKWGTDNLLITLGEHGAILFRRDAEPFHVPTRAREVFDVSGAGDTMIALYTLALAAGATPQEAAEIANHASGIVVGKLGTATVTRAELRESFEEACGS